MANPNHQDETSQTKRETEKEALSLRQNKLNKERQKIKPYAW
jgi:hypothetical protein